MATSRTMVMKMAVTTLASGVLTPTWAEGKWWVRRVDGRSDAHRPPPSKCEQRTYLPTSYCKAVREKEPPGG